MPKAHCFFQILMTYLKFNENFDHGKLIYKRKARHNKNKGSLIGLLIAPIKELIMKKLCSLLLSAAILFIAQHTLADTHVNGIITADTMWTMPNSPYIVTGNILVSSGVTLTINPGVTVKIDNEKVLQIGGMLVAIGTVSNKITFTSNQSIPAPGDWSSILFSESSTGSTLEHVVVEYGGGVKINNSRPLIDHATIRNNAAPGIFAWDLIGNLKITNSTIYNNFGSGISVSEDFMRGSVTILNNIISNNSSDFAGGGIRLDWIKSATIIGNIIINNSAYEGGGIYVDAFCSISNNIISNNSSSNDGGGILFDVGDVNYNTIINNKAKNSPAFKPLLIGSKFGSNDLTYNTIIGNKATGSVPTFAGMAYSRLDFNYNNLFDNDTTYELLNTDRQGTTPVDATNNFWGTATESEIQGKIYDWFDDSTFGIVDYIPWSTTIRTDAPISPPKGLTIIAEKDQIVLIWTANPEADAAGYKVYWDSDGFPYDNIVNVGNAASYTITGIDSEIVYIGVTAYDTNYADANDDPATIVNDNQTNGNESWYTETSFDPKNDTDGDGVPYYLDNCPAVSNPTQIDTDGDGDGNACDSDDDDDGMPDDWEDQYGLNPLVNDASDDPDNDGFSNLREYRAHTDPKNSDSHPSKGTPWIPLLLLDN